MSMWAVEWHNRNLLDADQRHLIWEHPPRLFRSRRECRAFIEEKYGYIREWPDLRSEPHGWRMPRAVQVIVCVKP